MSLLDEWRSIAYDFTKSKEDINKFWEDYFAKEAKFYDVLLNISEHPILDTVENFAHKFNVDIITMIGFLDGINDSLKIPNNIDNITEKTIVTLDYDADILYENAIKSDAKHIYNLSAWDKVLPNRSNKIQSDTSNFKQANTTLNIPKCPTCGSTNIKKISSTKRFVSTGLFGLASSNIGKTMECKNCGYKW